MTIELDFRQALRLDMERKGLTEAALGKALEISQQAVNKWIVRGFPPLSQLDNLLAVLGEGSEVSKLSHKAIYSNRSRTPSYASRSEKEIPNNELKLAEASVLYNENRTSQQSSGETEAWQPKLMRISPLGEARKTWLDFTKDFKAALPEALHGNLGRRVPTDQRPLEFDYASDRVVAEIVSVLSHMASHNFSGKILQLITYAQMNNPQMVKLLIVATNEPIVRLNQLVTTAAKAFDVRLVFVKSGSEAAKIVAETEEEETPELIEPDE